jgi:dihydroorotate dehydrogenase
MKTKEKLGVKFCGVDLKNPVVAASATPTRDFEEMKKCVESGVGALVGKSASFQPIERIHPSPCFYVMYPKEARQGRFYSLYSSAQLAEFTPEEYADQMKKIRPIAEENNCKIISDVMRGNLDEWKKMTEIFAPVSDILELNVGCPFASELAGEEKKGAAISSDVNLICQIIEAVREVTD